MIYSWRTSFTSLFVLLFFTVDLLGQCNINVDAGPDFTICEGESGFMNGVVSGNYDDYEWMPATGLGSPFDLNTSVTVTGPTIYKLVARGTGNDIIVNGGIESGNLAPSTTGFNFVTVNNFPLSPGGSYTIGTSVNFGNIWGCSVHGGTYAMAFNGTGAAGANIWCQTVNVNPNTEYKLEAWLMSVVIPFLTTAPAISIEVNGTVVASAVGSPTLSCSWTNASGTWNSGGATTATVCIVNNNGATNYGGLDDISMVECCVVEDEVMVDIERVNAQIEPAGPITCEMPTLILDASGSTSGPGYRYEWTTSNGRIISGGNTLNPVIGEPGTYTLRVISPNDCEDETTIEIEGNNRPPDLTTRDAVLSCSNSPVLVAVGSSISDVTYEWIGPNGFLSFDQSFTTDIPGTYFVKVEDRFKCFSIDSVVVLDQRSFPTLMIKGDTISCGKDSATLKAVSASWNLEYEWMRPDGSVSRDSFVTTADSGTYILTVIDSNDCTSSDTFELIKTDLAFNAFATADSITCSKPFATLTGFSDSANVTFRWVGPNGFVSDTSVVDVSDTGTYVLTVTYDSLCSTTDTVIVGKADDVPDITVVGDTIDCLNSIATLLGNSTTNGAIISWSGPNGFSSGDSVIMVTDSGTYTLKGVGLNGCEVEKDFKVIIDSTISDLILSSDTLNCLKDTVDLLISNDRPGDLFLWNGPSGFSSSAAQNTIDQAGLYVVTTTSQNGCTTTDSIRVYNDSRPPFVVLEGDTLNCAKTSINYTVSNPEVDSLVWQGPGGFTSRLDSISISAGGTYQLLLKGKNGCDTTFSFEVVTDTIPPDFTLAADTIDCDRSEVTIRVLTNSIGTYEWQGPNGFVSDLSTPSVRDSGWYILKLLGSNGCGYEDSVFVHQTAILPDIDAQGDTLTCVKSSVILKGSSSDNNVGYLWSDSQGNINTDSTWQIDKAGVYTFNVYTMSGCTSTIDVEVVADTIPPMILEIASDGLHCDSTWTNLRAVLDSTASGFEWSGPGGFSSTDLGPRVSEIGWYYLTATSSNGCSTTDSIFLVAQDTRPDLELISDTITCIQPGVQVQGISNVSDLDYSWIGPNGFTSVDSTINTNVPGLYILKVTDGNDCSTIDSIDVTANLSIPDITIDVDSIRCQSVPGKIITGVTPKSSTLNWTGPQSFSETSDSFSIDVPGQYRLIAVHPFTGCSDTQVVELFRSEDTIEYVSFELEDIDCLKSSGRLEILDVGGGHSPFYYTLDGSTSTNPVFDDLSSGGHTLVVSDKYGCAIDTSFEIEEIQNYMLISPGDFVINRGGSQQLLPITDIPDSIITSLTWSPGNSLSCTDCLTPVASPESTTTYTLTIMDKAGCVYSVTSTIEVIDDGEFYVPNVFSPNGDQFNDLFKVYANGEAVVLSFQIFDRWGELIYESLNEPIIDESQGWDGTFRSENVPPDVYVYLLRLEQGEKTSILKGSVTLLR